MTHAQQQTTGLESHGITNVSRVYWNLDVPALYEEAIKRHEGAISIDGPLVCRTGQHTGRSPNDKFIVREPSSAERVWWSKVNRPLEAHHFDALRQRLFNYMEGREIFVQDCYAGADPRYRLPVRIITEQAWHSLFARHMFIDIPESVGRPAHSPEFTVIDMPGLHAEPSHHGTNSEVFILLNFAKKLVLIGGTSYAGEIKKSIFTVMNYLLPLRNVLSMHCSANVGPADDVALFFGLSGTGKTTLSSDPERRLIGDDEHGWSEDGVFNFEGGCYAKMIRLSAEAEPQIYATTRRFGTVLENVKFDTVTRELDLDDDSADREHARGVSDRVHRQLPAVRAGRASAAHRHADRRRVRRAAADRAAVAGRRDVSLPLGLHGQGRGHREGRDGAEGDVQHLLRRAVHGPASDGLREVPRGSDRAASRESLARQHRVDGRSLRCRVAHEDRSHARPHPRGAGRSARRCAVQHRIRSSTSRCRSRCRASRPTC